MIRSTLYQLAKQAPASFPATLAQSAIKPAAVVLSGRLSGIRPKSTAPRRRDEDLLEKTYSDAFDESDSLERGKQEKSKSSEVPVEATERSSSVPRRARRYDGPLFTSLFGRNAGFDDLFFSRRDPFFSPFFSALRDHDPFEDLLPVFQRRAGLPDRTLLRASPGYEINESDESYQIEVQVPEGVRASDMKVTLEDDGSVLHVSGGLEKMNEEGRVIKKSSFDKLFTIGPNVDSDNIKAEMHDDGRLVLTAPKLAQVKEEPQHKTIPIKTVITATDEEVVQKNYSDAFDESDWAEKGKEKVKKS